MARLIIRIVILAWAAFFALLGLRGLFNPAVYTEMLGVTGDAIGMNTARADLSAFFLVSAISAAIGALIPGWQRALLVPAALFGAAFVGRGLGLVLGDPTVAGITQSMGIEAISAALMLIAMRVLGRGVVDVAAHDQN